MTTIYWGISRQIPKSQISYLQIRTIQGKSAEHRLTAVLQMGDKIEIRTSNSSDIIALADDVADILGVRVVWKE
jgi:hypothetical protein